MLRPPGRSTILAVHRYISNTIQSINAVAELGEGQSKEAVLLSVLHEGYMRQYQYRVQGAGNEERREKDGRDENMCVQRGGT